MWIAIRYQLEERPARGATSGQAGSERRSLGDSTHWILGDSRRLARQVTKARPRHRDSGTDFAPIGNRYK